MLIFSIVVVDGDM